MTPNIFIITQGTDSLLSNILSKFLDEIDDINLVNISFIEKNHNYVYGGYKRNYELAACFEVHNDDIDKIEKENEPIRIRCKTDVSSDSKEEFIEFFKKFKDLLSW